MVRLPAQTARRGLGAQVIVDLASARLDRERADEIGAEADQDGERREDLQAHEARIRR